MNRPVIALLTDFGLRDHYVAAMKGVILGIAPDAVLVDITHDIAPQDIVAAALELAACYSYFPHGAIFLVVVDPGVGTLRHAIAAAAGDYVFVAPDNGVLAPVLDHFRPTVVQITNCRFARPDVSRTFEGRDRFAPAAAWLARGTDIRELGMELPVYQRLDLATPRRIGQVVEGDIVKIDRFGNLISNIGRESLSLLDGQPAMIVRIGEQEVRPVTTYAEVGAGEPCALVGSSGYVEVSVNGGSAADRLALGPGARLVVARDYSALAEYDQRNGPRNAGDD